MSINVSGSCSIFDATDDIYTGAVAPADKVVGSLWLDTSAQVLKRWNGTVWVEVVDSRVGDMQTVITQTRAAIGLSAGETYTDPDSLITRTQRAEQWITPRNILMVVDDGENESHLQLDNSGLYVNGGTFGINVSGMDGDTTFDEEGLTVPVVNSPSVVRRYCGRAAVTVDAAATDEQLEAGTHFRSVSDAFASINNCQIDYDITINVTGTLYEDPTLVGTFGGGSIIVDGGTIVGELAASGCANRLRFSNITIMSRQSDIETGYGAFIERCALVEILACTFSGVCMNAVHAHQVNNLSIAGSMFSGAGNCVYYYYCGAVQLNTNRGICENGCYIGESSIGFRSGARPSGSITDQRYGAQLFGTTVVDTGGETPPTPPVIEKTTQAFRCTASNTYRGGGWRGSGDVWQGYQGGRNYGCYWFNGLEAAIAGRTVVSATLKLRRMTGYGSGSRVPLNVYACGNASASGTISKLAGGSAGSINQGEQKTVTLSNAALQGIADGSGHGLVLDTGETANASGKSYSAGYARLNGVGSNYVPVLTVTYQ